MSAQLGCACDVSERLTGMGNWTAPGKGNYFNRPSERERERGDKSQVRKRERKEQRHINNGTHAGVTVRPYL